MNREKHGAKLSLEYSIKDKDFIFIVLVSMIWTHSILGDYFRAILLRFPIISTMPDLIIVLFYCFMILLAIPYIWKRVRPSDVAMYVFVALVCIFSLFFGNDKNIGTLQSIVPQFLLFCAPLLFIGICLDTDRVIPLLYILSTISIYALAFYILFIGGGSIEYRDSMNEDMYSAYKLLPHLLLVCFFVLHKPNVKNIITFIFGTILLFSFGTRGPILCLTLYVALYLLVFKTYKNNVRSKVIIVLVTTIFLIFFEQILGFIMLLSSSLGMSTRVFSRLLDGTFLTHLSGRDIFQQLLITAIKERPWLGYGVAGDRMILYGSYAHNIILELLVSYGVPIGVILLLRCLFKIFKGLNSNITEYNTAFILILVCCSFIKLFFSGTYLNEPLLFLLLGICENSIRQKRAQKRMVNNNENTLVM